MTHQIVTNNRPLRTPGPLARQRGASLLEALAYLGIAAVVVLGAISLLTGAFSSAKTNQTNEEVVAMRTAVRKLYMGQTYPAGTLQAALISANAIPGTLTRAAGGALANGWGGAVTVAGTGGTFTVTYNAVPQDVCISLVSGATDWVSISGNGANAVTIFPATVDNATTMCTVAGAAGNTLAFTAT